MDKFTFKVLVECNIDNINDIEIKLIEEYNTLAPNGYNLTKGGQNYIEISDITKEKMSISAKNRIHQNLDEIR